MRKFLAALLAVVFVGGAVATAEACPWSSGKDKTKQEVTT